MLTFKDLNGKVISSNQLVEEMGMNEEHGLPFSWKHVDVQSGKCVCNLWTLNITSWVN